ncbi:MAG: BrnT family toxin [Rhodospirillales bacterium]|nr:BrnT family toxin [Rhodospirillales bacterium]
MRGVWDPKKDRINRQKHGIGFETALGVFSDPFALSALDRIEDGEERWQTIGLIEGVAVVLVAHVFRDDGEGDETVRIISARRATRRERRRYEEERAGHA